ncbi:MAG: acyl-CoA dehydrogenase family protein [Ktedonobacteraceae bacterium]
MAFPAYPTTDRQKKLVAITSELATTFAKRANENDWAGRFPIENYKDLQASGYLTLTVPRDFGGWGADLLEVSLAQQQLAQGDGATALVMSMHLANVAKLAENATGPNAFFERLCHAVVNDGAIINNAASEPATGSPSRGGKPTTIARRQEDGSWRITGRKSFTTGSPILTFFIVSCSIEDTTNLSALGADRGSFLIPRTAQGLQVKETWNSLSMRGSGSNDIILDNVHVDADAFVDAQIPTNAALQTRLAAWSFPTTAVYLGIATAARNEAIAFARKRKPTSLDKPIASVPHIQEKAAKMELALLQSRAVFYGIAAQFSAAPDSIPASQFAAAKYLVSNHAIDIVDSAMRLMGAASLSMTMPMQRYYRDVRAGLQHPPMDDAAIAAIGKYALEEK